MGYIFHFWYIIWNISPGFSFYIFWKIDFMIKVKTFFIIFFFSFLLNDSRSWFEVFLGRRRGFFRILFTFLNLIFFIILFYIILFYFSQSFIIFRLFFKTWKLYFIIYFIYLFSWIIQFNISNIIHFSFFYCSLLWAYSWTWSLFFYFKIIIKNIY